MGAHGAGVLVVGLGVVAYIVVVLAPPEVLPLITAHDVEMMASVEVLIVLGVGVEGKVALGDLIVALAAVVDAVRAVGRGPGVLLSVGEVRTESGVEPESLEAVDLIVDLCAADDRTAVGDVLLEVQQRDRVRGSVALPSIRPCIVVERSAVSPPLEIVREVGGIRGGLVIDALGRIHLGGGPDRVAVGILGSGVHSLGVEVDVEMVVKERRVEVDGSRSTLEIRSLQDTLLVGEADRYTVRKVLRSTGDSDVVVMADGGAVDLALPVGIGSSESIDRILVHTGIQVGDELAELIAGHHVHELLAHAGRDGTVVGDLGSLVGAALLGRDDDDTVGSAGTVDGGCGSVLQDVEALDIGRIDHGEEVGQTLDTVVVHCKTVDDDERVIGSVQGRTSTDTDGRAATRGAAGTGNADAGDLAGQHILGVHDDTLVLGVRFKGGHRAGEVALLDGTVADDHDLVEELAVLLEGDGARHLGCLEGKGRVTDAADLDDRIGARDVQDEVTVDARHGAVVGTLLDDCRTDDGAHGVGNNTLHLISALGEHRSGHQA